MNNRAVELYIEAMKYAVSIVKMDHPEFHAITAGKLSELIVKECANQCDIYAADVLKFSQFGSNAAKDCSAIIKKHFEDKK